MLTFHTILRSVLAASVMAAGPALAADFPIKDKPIRIIVAFPPGGGVDAQARVVAPRLAEAFGVPVIVENKPGGGTLLAASEVMKAVPDGHTIFYSASSTMAQNPHTSIAATYNPMTDFTPISLGARGPLLILVSSKLPVSNVKELVAYGKANPGKLSYASFGTGTSSHVFGQVFAQNAGIEMEHIPYKGGAELAADLFEGRVQVAFDAAPSGIKNASTGRARILGVAAPERTSLLPDVPTVLEQGVKGVDTVSFLGWFGPAKMPPDVVSKLNAALIKAIAQSDVQALYRSGAYTAESSTPEQLASEVRTSYETWGRLVKAAGIKKQ